MFYKMWHTDWKKNSHFQTSFIYPLKKVIPRFVFFTISSTIWGNIYVITAYFNFMWAINQIHRNIWMLLKENEAEHS